VRHYWWNLDHLELIAARLRLDRVRPVLDAQSGRVELDAAEIVTGEASTGRQL
jgi:hypothetical protein